MLTEEQKKWISHLSAEKKIEILPYNPKSKEIFEKVKREIEGTFGDVEVLHGGSTMLEIPGQGEVDLYIPVLEKDFNGCLEKLIKHFGQPGSIYPLKRVRFVIYKEDIKVEIFLMNKETEDGKNLFRFENYLKKNKKDLEKYIKIKKESNGLSMQEYYKKKLEFINKIFKNA